MKTFLILLFTLIFNSVFSQSFSTTQGNPKSNNWTIIWGGMPHKVFGHDFMRERFQKYFKKENVIWSDYQISADKLRKYLQELNPNYDLIAVYGFSRGGSTAYSQIGKVRFVGLIDPTIPNNYETGCSSTEVRMVYNPDVWGAENRKKLLRVAETYNKSSFRVDIPHLKIPDLFFTDYKYQYYQK
jgi:hypothetical protein